MPNKKQSMSVIDKYNSDVAKAYKAQLANIRAVKKYTNGADPDYINRLLLFAQRERDAAIKNNLI